MLINFKTKFLVSVFLCVVCLCTLKALGQSQHISFIPVEPEILSNSQINCFFKDSKGYMWFGTNEGLVRYDGTNIRRYQHDPSDSTSITHNNVNAIAESVNGNLWIGTARGISKFEREKDQFIYFHSIPNIKGWLTYGYITSLVFDAYGKLWIGTHGGGVYSFNLENLEISRLNYSNLNDDGSSDKFITALLYVNNKMWCGTMGGIRVFDVTKMALVNQGVISGTLPENQVTAFIKDQKDNIWISTLNGDLFKGTNKTGNYFLKKEISTSTTNQAPNNIWTICNDSTDNIWIGGENSGLNYLNLEDSKITHFGPGSEGLQKLPTAYIRSIFIDDLDYVWIGTFNHGIFIIDNSSSKFSEYLWGDVNPNDIIGNEITCFTQQENGDLFLASNDVGLIKIDSKTSELSYCKNINRRFASTKITSLIFDTSDNLWIGTGEGLYKFNLKTQKIKKYDLISGGFGDNKPSILFKDKKGVLWAGTNGSGLFYLNKKTDGFTNLHEKNQRGSISNISYISSFAEDEDGMLWVGTLYGLYRLDRIAENSFNYKSFHQNRYDSNSISSSGIQSLAIDKENNLWIGTADNGLNLKEKGSDSFIKFNTEDGLASNVIRGLTIDASGNLWISSNTGLTKMNLETRGFKKYNQSNGLMSNGFLPNACLITREGKMLFGSNKGMSVFYPNSIDAVMSQPKFYFTDLKINNQLVDVNDSNSPLKKTIELSSDIELNYKQRSFTLNFAAVNFDPSFKYEYCYMLEGFDKEWNYIGTNTSATYTNIDPGNYVFLVRVLNHGESINVNPLQLGIKIKPIIWLTWWAKLLYVLLLSFIAYFLVRIRLERIKIKNQLVLEKLAREKEHELLESKTQFFTDISHEFRTPLSLISLPLENMDMETLPKSVKKGLKLIKTNTDRMFRLVNELMDFSKMENDKLKLSVQEGDLIKLIKGISSSFYDLATKKNISFEVNIVESKLIGWFDFDKLEKILVNIISNAFKFTSNEGKISLVVKQRLCEDDTSDNTTRFIEIQIIDNGIGIPQNEIAFIFEKFYQVKSTGKVVNSGTGIGLSLTKGLVELHRGTINVESITGEKTKFVILIPIDKQIYLEDELIETSSLLYTQEVNNFIVQESLAKDEGQEPNENNNLTSTILIVEDNDDLREYLALELGKQFIIIKAKNGQEGFDIAADIGPDLIISDIAMPVKTGMELCEEIKANIKTSHIPFILLTAKTSIDDQVSGIYTGADIYITKPFSIRFLVAQVNQIIDSRKKLYTQFSQNVYLLPSMAAKNEIDKEFLQKIINYIIGNIQNSDIGVNHIAEMFNLSQKQVYRKIKALTGKSVVGFTRMVRIKEALKLMETQKYTLKEIAYMTGFNSASYFTISFKKEYGKAPSEFLGEEYE